MPACDLVPASLPGLHQLDNATYAKAAARIQARHCAVRPRRAWQVSLPLSIEARTPTEAVREFWTYLEQLGPQELPVFVHPHDDELAMRAYVNGQPARLDPDEGPTQA